MGAIAEVYQNDGCVLVENFFTKQECTWLADILEPIHSSWVQENGTSIYEKRLINSHSLTHKKYFSEENREQRVRLFNFLSSDKIITTLTDLLGKELFFLNTQLFFNPDGYRKDGYWHRDTQYLGKLEEEQKKIIFNELLLHLHIPLLNDAIFEYVPGSHKRWDTPQELEVRLEKNGHKNSEAMPGARAFPAKVGDVIFFSVHGIHRGRAYEESPRRRTFDIIYGKWYEGASAFDPDCLPTPEELFKIKNKQLFRNG